MKYFNKTSLSILLALVCILPLSMSADAGFTRVKVIGDTGANLTYQYQDVNSSVTDSSGNVYLGGCFTGTADFDPGAGTDIHAYTRGVLTNAWNAYCDAYITKLDSSGNHVWTKTWGGETDDYVRGLAVDASGNVYASSVFQNTVDFDPGAGTSNMTAHNDASSSQPWDWDVAVTKLNSSGDFVWAKSWGCNNTNVSTFLVLDSSNNVYVAGHQGCTIDFDPGAGTTNLTASGSTAFINKLDSDGTFVWARNFSNAALDYAAPLSIDASNNIYLSAAFQGTVDFDPEAGTSNMVAVGAKNAYVVKLSSAGVLVWAKNISEGTTNAYGSYSKIDSSGNVYVGGYFAGTGDFDPGAGTSNMTAAGLTDAFVVKLDSSGTFVWAKQVGGASDDAVYSIGTDTSGNVYIAGKFAGTVDFDPGAGTSNLTSNGDADLFILKLDSSGLFQYVKQVGGSGIDFSLYGINVLAEDTLYLGGGFRTTVDFDPTAGISSITSTGDVDAFLLRLDPADTTPSTITFSSQTDKSASTTYASNTITVAGINTGATITISNCANATACEYSLNSAAFTSTSGTVVNGDTIILRMTSSPNSGGTSTLSVAIGASTVTFVVVNAEFAAVPVFILQAQSNAIRAQENNTPPTPVITPTNTIVFCEAGQAFNPNTGQKCTPYSTTGPVVENTNVGVSLFTTTIEPNSKGTEVTKLQTFLKNQGTDIYPSGLITGTYGPLTKSAVGRFQIKYGIVVNSRTSGYGRVGPKTLGKINEIGGLQ